MLICVKKPGHQKGVTVLSNDASLPSGLDVFEAAQVNPKAGFNECTIFFGKSSKNMERPELNFSSVTRRRIHPNVVSEWAKKAAPLYAQFVLSLENEPDESGDEADAAPPAEPAAAISKGRVLRARSGTIQYIPDDESDCPTHYTISDGNAFQHNI